MYIRWKTQSRVQEWELRPGARWRTKTKPVTLYVAYLVECVHIDGKSRQKQRYLASIKDDHIESTSVRFYFWQTAQKKFQLFTLSIEQQHTLKTKLLVREWE